MQPIININGILLDYEHPSEQLSYLDCTEL